MSKGIQSRKIITSHKSRVQRAEAARMASGEIISIFDREAYVEFYLLEDIVRLYQARLDAEKQKVVDTYIGRLAKERNIQKFEAIILLFKSAVEVAWAMISSGNYKAVWKNIPEHALMVAANNVKYLPKLREIGVDMLKTISDETMVALEENYRLGQDAAAVVDHEVNVRTVKNMPSAAEIDAVIKAVEAAIPDKDAPLKQNINTNS